MPILKSQETGKLVGALSSDALDREDEIIGTKLLHKWKDSQAIPALTDHTNSINTYAGGWKNFRIEKSQGKTFLLADPVFFKSNPNTAHLEAMVREAKELGLPFGISIGAIVKEVSNVTVGNKSALQWDDAELLEASWVAIPANQTAGIKSAMKSLNLGDTLEESDIKPKMVKEEKTVKTEKKEVKAPKEKVETKEKTFNLDEVKTLIAEEVSKVKEEMKSIKENTNIDEKVSDAIAKALETMEAEKKSVKSADEKELDITNLTNG